MKHDELELRHAQALYDGLKQIDQQLMAGHAESARNIVHYLIADAKLLGTLIKNRSNDATNRVEPH